MKNIILVGLLLLGFLVYGCAGSIKSLAPKQETPIDVSEQKLPAVGVAKIESSLTPGQEVGAHYEGLMKVRKQTYYAEGYVSDAWQEKYEDIVIDELSNAGYKTKEQSDIFEMDDSFNARFLVGGIIRNSTLQSFGFLAGNYTESLISIEWQLFDRIKRDVIYKLQTDGYGQVSGVSMESYTVAVRNCFKNLLADKGFVEILKMQDTEVVETKVAETIIFSTEYIEFDSSANMIDFVSNAIFAIKTEEGHGSGFIFNKMGYALTNYHVVAGRSRFDAIFNDGKVIRVNVIDTKPELDLALLKLTGTNYPYLVFCEKEMIELGEEVYAIGTPLVLGLSHSISKGVVSGIRDIDKYTLIQTDAAINPGNSGGPLIDEDGKVLGIVSLKIVGQGVEGLGFAISVDEAINGFNMVRSK